jgi:hypothetical protein
MKRTGSSLILIVSFLFCVWAPAQETPKEPAKEPPKEVNISGTWDMVTQSPQGEMPGEATFTQEKEIVKISMTGPQGMPLSGEGTIKEGVVQWAVTLNTPNGDFTVYFKGKVDGEKISGEVQAGDFGTFPWSATKRKSGGGGREFHNRRF